MTIFSVNAVLLSLIFGNPSVLSLILNFAFFFIIFSFAYVKILEFVNVKEGEEEENEDFAFISEEKMQYWVNLVLQKVNKMLMKFKKNERLGEFYCEIKVCFDVICKPNFFWGLVCWTIISFGFYH